MMGSWRLTGKPPRQDRHTGFPAKIPKIILRLEIPVIWVFAKNLPQLVTSLFPAGRYPAAKSHTDHTVHQVLGSCGFHSCTFSKNSPNIQLMRFSLQYINEGIPSLMRFWLKFMFSKKAIKIDKIFTVDLTFTK